jgi:siroheme synthase
VLTAGHRAAGNSAAEWSKFNATESTLLVYMPGHDYAEMADRLTAAGFAKETPCAIISRATTPRQQIHCTTISNLHRSPRLAAPTLLVVGEVVKFADHAGQPETGFPVMVSAFAAALGQSAISGERLRQEEQLA